MLETDEVDADLFTATPGTSLATIFSATQGEQEKENTTLKYIPQVPMQPPQPVQDKVDDKTKPQAKTSLMFATVVLGYEWLNGTYNVRKNLSLAIYKLAKENTSQIVLYNSEKQILSVASMSPAFIVNVKKGAFISYYDNHKKYWLIYGVETKINKIIDCLNLLKVNINFVVDNKAPPDKINENLEVESPTQNNTESETDSSSNFKSKDTILRKIASMGHSVLPSNDVHTQTSDSTDEVENVSHHKLPRHKFVKSVTKKSTHDKPLIPSKGKILDSKKALPFTKTNNCLDLPSKQEIALRDSTNMNSPSHTTNLDCDMNNFISEQRMNNTELRMNLNRMTDKLEKLLINKNNGTECNKFYSSTNETIVEKLLKEYENKINSYENFFKSKGYDCNLLIPTPDSNHKGSETGDNSEQIDNTQLALLCKEKDLEIEHLKMELEATTKAQANITAMSKKCEDALLNNITELKQAVDEKNDVINKLNENIQNILKILNNGDLSNQIKKIMNGTFQNIASHFDDEQNYLGASVKTIVGTAIKNSTLESLNNVGNDYYKQ